KSRKDILGIIVSCYIRLKRNKKLKDVADSLLIFTTRGEGNLASPYYRKELLEIFNTLDDYRLRSDAPEFREAIESAIQARPN
ncbi:hypothetical protein AAEQ01_23060, partial [Escherichia coli]|nr:hypothetical protein [Escherichia coli]